MTACTEAGQIFHIALSAATFCLAMWLWIGLSFRPAWWKKAAKELTTASISDEDRLALQRNSRVAEELTAELKRARR